MLTKVKLCGINDIKTLKFCIKVNVDALGFVFYKKSKRYINIKKMQYFASYIPSYIKIFAIVVEYNKKFIHKLFKKVRIDYLQYYGSRKKKIMKICKHYCVNFLEVCRIKNNYLKRTNRFISVEKYNKKYGGFGKTLFFNNIFKNRNIMISGGISIKNVYYIIRTYKPVFIDISSGIEKKGNKSLSLIKTIIREVNLSNLKNVC
ncbi:phosphoribosylanthranilate isomerase [Candidatus Vidania fulgoroideorum]